VVGRRGALAGLRPRSLRHQAAVRRGARSLVAFASEIQALVAPVWSSASIDPAGVLGYLAWGTVPPSLTCVAGVESLAPGTWLRWYADGGRVHAPFADVAAVYARPMSGCDAIASSRASRRGGAGQRRPRHLVADVPVGVFLSGGIDSSAILSAASDAGARGLNTYTVRFDDRSSEHEYARLVASDLRRDAPRARPRPVADRRPTCRASSRASISRRSTRQLVLCVGRRRRRPASRRCCRDWRRRTVRPAIPRFRRLPRRCAEAAAAAIVPVMRPASRGAAAAADRTVAAFHVGQRPDRRGLPDAARLFMPDESSGSPVRAPRSVARRRDAWRPRETALFDGERVDARRRRRAARRPRLPRLAAAARLST
jgi:hypothetical protein